MHTIGPSGRVTSSTGNVDLYGDVMNRLRAQVGSDRTDAIDPDEQARLVRDLLVRAPLARRAERFVHYLAPEAAPC